MAEDLKPAPTRSRLGRGPAFAVLVAGALLACCAVLPWAGLQATSSLFGAGVASDVRGIDDPLGVYTLLAGLTAVGCGVAGLLARPRLAALAIVPGSVAVFVLVTFVMGDGGLRDRVSIHLGDLLSIEPVIRSGWFAALACAVAVVLLSVLTLVRR
ncbi:hypothetical protein AB0K18_19480 [Nonomuraea sp. NPDC049421]|uniref:hypothetical protein n=1 Tax=Nonomuraea sp. NPDC049421 TaxID=3155275 RepID=UPI00342A780F